MTVETPPAHPDPLRLHKAHPTFVGFFDETGAIASDRFFTVGLLCVGDHSMLLKKVRALRKRYKYWDEFKWHSITDANKHVYKALIVLLLGEPDVRFSCFVADRHVADPVARFGNTFAAYEKLAVQLALGSIKPYELMTVIADNYSAPNERNFESTVRSECNHRLRRLAIVSVIQVDSQATEGLQLVDILTGAVGFEFKANAGLASHLGHRGEVSAFLRTQCATSTFNKGFSSTDFGVAIYEHAEWLRREQAKLKSGSAVEGSDAKKTPARRRRRRKRPVPPVPPTPPVPRAETGEGRQTRRKRRGGRGRQRPRS